tara:strand:+ start:5049 stop:5342 length:294 start_codon:yes stop_codon:yes gene_type:complete
MQNNFPFHTTNRDGVKVFAVNSRKTHSFHLTVVQRPNSNKYVVIELDYCGRIYHKLPGKFSPDVGCPKVRRTSYTDFDLALQHFNQSQEVLNATRLI